MGEVREDLKYTKTHEWVRAEGKTATVGITDFAQEELHEIVFVELPEVGRSVSKGSEFAAVESVKARSEIYSPLSGKVTKVNGELIEGTAPAKPELLNEDPYGKGWLVEIEMTDPKEIGDLLSPAEYSKLLTSK